MLKYEKKMTTDLKLNYHQSWICDIISATNINVNLLVMIEIPQMNTTRFTFITKENMITYQMLIRTAFKIFADETKN